MDARHNLSVWQRKNVKSFPGRKTHRAALISVFSPQPDTSLHCQITDTGLVHRAVCLFTSQLSLVLTARTTEGWPGWVDLGISLTAVCNHRIIFYKVLVLSVAV